MCLAEEEITAKIGAINAQLPKLGTEQLSFIQSIVDRLSQPFTFDRNLNSDLVSGEGLRDFGDMLRVHHVLSAESLSKDRFEYALEKVLNDNEIPAKRSSRGNPGHDLTIRGVPFSLKTEGSKGIKSQSIHISKFMEMGKGQWTDQLSDLDGLRERFFNHMKSYAAASDVLIDVPLPLHRAGNRRWQLRRELSGIIVGMTDEQLQRTVYWARSIAQ